MTHANQKQQLYCRVQNRLGAMDRVLGALTHRGFIPERMASSIHTDNQMEITIRFHCEDAKTVEKLVKFLQKQVYVIEARILNTSVQFTSADLESSSRVPHFVTDVIHFHNQRRATPHVHNA